MDSAVLFAWFFALCGAGALVALVVPGRYVPTMLAWVASAAAIVLLWAAGAVFISGTGFEVAVWCIAPLGTLRLAPDRLSALFVIVTALVYLPVSIFSAGYLERYAGRYSLRAFAVMYFALFASIVLLLIAADTLSFLLAWEAMSILTYLLVNFEHEHEEHTRAGYLMLAMGEAGTLAAAVALLIVANAGGSLEFAAMRSARDLLHVDAQWAVFLLSFFGFGVKAGLVPVNSWLPRAHPAAPANVSALLSGVILNLGLYGIVRVNVDLAPLAHTGPGLIALVIGTVSAFVGILYATIENDLKRMLAHSSIENLGIVTAALGAALVFAANGHAALSSIAFVAAFYHMTNHSVYKALLFLGAGTIDSHAGTRDLDRLGGLIHAMPWTSLFFLVGALSISAVYPFNGFASEWLTLQALLRSVELSAIGVKIVFAVCGAMLALTAALAVTCFVKAFAMAFLGMARSTHAGRITEAGRAMLAPMGMLAALCVVLGILPTYVISALDRVVAPMTKASATTALVPPFFAQTIAQPPLPQAFVEEFRDLGAQVGEDLLPGRGVVVLHRGEERNPVVFAMSTSYGFVVLVLLLAIVFGAVRWATHTRAVVRAERWAGGVRRLLPEMTYTATGFSNPVRVVFAAIMRPRTVEDARETVEAHFRTAIRRVRQEDHPVDRLLFGLLGGAFHGIARLLARMHHGQVNAYVAYVLLTLVIFLVLGELL